MTNKWLCTICLDERQEKAEMSDRQQHKQATESNIKGQTTAEEVRKQSA